MVTVTKIVEPAEFQPVKILLVLETEDEFAALQEMTGYNVRIPRLVATGDSFDTPNTEQKPMAQAAERVLSAIRMAMGE